MRIATRFLKPPSENSRIEIFNPDKSRVEKNKTKHETAVKLFASEVPNHNLVCIAAKQPKEKLPPVIQKHS